MEDESPARQNKPKLYAHIDDGPPNRTNLYVFLPSNFAVEAIMIVNRLPASVP